MTDPKQDSPLDDLARDDSSYTEAIDDLDSGMAEVRTGDAWKVDEVKPGDPDVSADIEKTDLPNAEVTADEG